MSAAKMGTVKMVTVQDIHENLVFGRGHALAGIQKAQHLMPHAPMHMPSKETVVTIVVLLHVLALSYLLYALYTAQRRTVPAAKPREPPKKVNCVYEWASAVGVPRASVMRLPLGIRRV